MKQVEFLDYKDSIIRGGIKLKNNDIICACCGGIIKHDDPSIAVLKVYPEWIDFSETIID